MEKMMIIFLCGMLRHWLLLQMEKKTKIEDIMTTGCFTVRPDLSVEDLIKIIQEKNFNSMPVVDNQGTLIGIVSIMDVIKLL